MAEQAAASIQAAPLRIKTTSGSGMSRCGFEVAMVPFSVDSVLKPRPFQARQVKHSPPVPERGSDR